MTFTIEARFSFGRYHGTPWDRSVNEGAIEWPPSPWRLARAIYATFCERCEHLDKSVLLAALAKLGQPPRYHLPPWIETHTRHYFPDIAYSSDKVFDPFVVVERDQALSMTWDSELTLGEAEVLREVLAHVSYLGRADSICELSLVADSQTVRAGMACEPINGTASGDVIPVLCFAGQLTPSLLEQRSVELRKAGLTSPEGTRWIDYDRPPFVPDERVPSVMTDGVISAVRFAIAPPVRPSRFSALAMTDILRQAVLARFGAQNDGRSEPLLAGRAHSGSPLVGHRHAHYLAIDSDGDGLLDHLAVWVPAQLDESARLAVASVRQLSGYGHIRDFRSCRLAVEAVGDTAATLPELVGPSTRWESFTPFVAARHERKGDLTTRLLNQVRLECEWRGLASPVRVAVKHADGLAFRRTRPTRERLADGKPGYMLNVEFAEEVVGPLVLGRHSHFGLGMFLPIQER